MVGLSANYDCDGRGPHGPRGLKQVDGCSDWRIGAAIAWLTQVKPGYSTDRHDEKAEKFVRNDLPNTNEDQFAKIGLEIIRPGKQA